MEAAEKLAPEVGTAAACRQMGVSRATVYRRRKPQPANAEDRSKCRHPRALSVEERRTVLDMLHADRFVNKAPANVYATLLDEGTYQCRKSTLLGTQLGATGVLPPLGGRVVLQSRRAEVPRMHWLSNLLGTVIPEAG